MANTLTAVIPTILEAMDQVSRELTGFIPAVYKNSSAERAAKDQTINYPIIPAVAGEDIAPADHPKDSGDTTPTVGSLTISKSRAFPVRLTGEDTKGLATSGQAGNIMRDRFAQALRAAVNEVEADIAGLYKYASRAYGTAGVAPFSASFADAAAIQKILDDNGCPNVERNLILDTTAALNLRSLSGFTDASAAGSADGLRRGILAPLYGLDIRQSAQVKAHTKGTATGFDVNHGDGYSVGDTAIVTDGCDAGTMAAGDVVTWAGDANKYLVTSCMGSGAAVTLINLGKPGLMATLANTVEGTIGDSYRANLAFHRQAIHLVTRAPAMPDGGDAADDAYMLTDPVTGLSFEVRVYRQYHRVKYEVCLAWGCGMVKPEWAAVLLG